MKNEELVKAGKEVVSKSTGRGGKDNFPTSIANHTKKEDVTRIMGNLLKWYKLPRIASDDECEERLWMFFDTCFTTGEVPTCEKMCLALGYSRKTVWEWEVGLSHSSRRADLIKKAKEMLASFDAEMVTEGKINPITYIFRAKNYFGMKDQQEMVITPNNPLGENANQEEIQKRITGGVVTD